MRRTGRTLVILTVATSLAALTPAIATSGPADDDPIGVEIGIGGELIDILSHDEDDGDEDNGDGLLEVLVEVVDEVLVAIFGEDDDSVHSPPALT
ncbi:MAG: hypothetical protein M3357_06405, partial [Actinomycetota bacterium]|nr:hypothetical protein [Actinomycetota bacterium]